jgi:hypothetical protein
MKLVWHIVWKDVRRLALPLGLLTLLTLARCAVGWRLIEGGGGDADWFRRWRAVALFLTVIETAATYLFVAVLVGEDSPIGTRALWLTRPISGSRMLAAKVASAVLMFGALPVAVLLPWWTYNGYGLRELAAAIRETLEAQALVAIVPFMLAALTDSLSRVLLWTVVAAGVVMTWFLFMSATAFGIFGEPLGVVWTRSTLSLALVVLATFTATVVQYHSRQTPRSVVIVTGFAAAVLLVGVTWPWNLWPTWSALVGSSPTPIPDRMLLDRGVEPPNSGGTSPRAHPTVHFQYADAFTPDLPGDRAPNARFTLYTRFAVTGLPPDRALDSGLVAQRWVWAEGVSLERTEYRNFYLEPMSQSGIRDPATRAALGLPPARTAEGRHVDVWSALPRSFGARITQRPPAYHAEITYYLARPVALIELPVRDGGWQANGAFRARVARARGPELELWTSGPVFARPHSIFARLRWADRYDDVTPVLVDRTGDGWLRGLGGSAETTRIATVAINRFAVAPVGLNGRGPGLAQLTDARLVWLAFRDYEQYRQVVDVDRYGVRLRRSQ